MQLLSLLVAACVFATALSRSAYIINGDATKRPGKWPWQASIEYKWTVPSKWGHWCGAALISDRWLLTAAHCKHERDGGEIPGTQDFRVVLGLHDQFTRKQGKPQTYFIKRWIYNPLFENNQAKAYPNDISLVKTDGKVEMNQYVWPVGLPDEGQRESYLDDKYCMQTGFGTSDLGPQEADGSWPKQKYENILQQIPADVIPTSRCKNKLPGMWQESMICVISKKADSTACWGDSGGPLVCREKKTDSWELAGITSFVSTGCNLRAGNVYSSVNYFRQWIRDTARV